MSDYQYLLFVISHRVFIFHLLLLLFLFDEAFQEKSETDACGVTTRISISFARKSIERITVFKSPPLLQVYFSLTFWSVGINGEFIPM